MPREEPDSRSGSGSGNPEYARRRLALKRIDRRGGRPPEPPPRGENFVRLWLGFGIGMGVAVQILEPDAGRGRVAWGDLGFALYTGMVFGMLYGVTPSLLLAFLARKRIRFAFTLAFLAGAGVVVLNWLSERGAGEGA